jgi:uncharacterized protein involved in exopolysaccharide biosynthesis
MAKIKITPAAAIGAVSFPGNTNAAEAADLAEETKDFDAATAELNELQRREQELRLQLGDAHPTMLSIRNQIASLSQQRSNLAQRAASLRHAAHPTRSVAPGGSHPATMAENFDSTVGAGTYDPYQIQTECEVIRSQVILDKVIEDLNLTREWGNRFGNGQPLKSSETLAILQRQIEVRPVRNTSLLDIRAFSDRPDEAARIANRVALAYQVYRQQTESGPRALVVEIIDRATPPYHPFRPNKPLNIFLAAIAGLVLGTVAGAVSTGLRSRPKTK